MFTDVSRCYPTSFKCCGQIRQGQQDALLDNGWTPGTGIQFLPTLLLSDPAYNYI